MQTHANSSPGFIRVNLAGAAAAAGNIPQTDQFFQLMKTAGY